MTDSPKHHPTFSNILLSSEGEVFRLDRLSGEYNRVKGTPNTSGYLTVKIEGVHKSIHRLICETYYGEILKGYEVNHINAVKEDNRLDNLELITKSQNQIHRRIFKNTWKLSTLWNIYQGTLKREDTEIKKTTYSEIKTGVKHSYFKWLYDHNIDFREMTPVEVYQTLKDKNYFELTT